MRAGGAFAGSALAMLQEPEQCPNIGSSPVRRTEPSCVGKEDRLRATFKAEF